MTRIDPLAGSALSDTGIAVPFHRHGWRRLI
jgi:hypothetical protein